MSATTYYLVVPANGTPRITKSRTRLKSDEVAYRLRVTVPDAWGTIRGELAITMPEPPAAVEVEAEGIVAE